MNHVHLVIHGRVQGVGFRYFAVSEARARGLRGVVRNLRSGAVEIEAEGDLEVLREFVRTVRRGPDSARVSDVEESWSEGPARHRGFAIAP